MFTERGLSHHVRLKLTLGFPQLKDVTGESVTIQTSGYNGTHGMTPLNTFAYIGEWGRRTERLSKMSTVVSFEFYLPLKLSVLCADGGRMLVTNVRNLYRETKHSRGASCSSHKHCLYTVHTFTKECRAACVCKAYPTPPPLEGWRRDRHPILLFLENNTLQMSSKVSLAVSPGRTTVRAG